VCLANRARLRKQATTDQERHSVLGDGYEAAGDDDAEGVETTEADKYDVVFGDSRDFMDADDPQESRRC